MSNQKIAPPYLLLGYRAIFFNSIFGRIAVARYIEMEKPSVNHRALAG